MNGVEFNNNFELHRLSSVLLEVTHTWGDVVQLRHLEGLPCSRHVLQHHSLRCDLSNALLVVVDVAAKPTRIRRGGAEVYHHVLDILHVGLLHLSNN